MNWDRSISVPLPRAAGSGGSEADYCQLEGSSGMLSSLDEFTPGPLWMGEHSEHSEHSEQTQQQAGNKRPMSLGLGELRQGISEDPVFYDQSGSESGYVTGWCGVE